MNLIAGRLVEKGEHPKAEAISHANDLYVSNTVTKAPLFADLESLKPICS